MARRRDECNRVLGPTWIPSKNYWRIICITPEAVDPKKRRTAQYHREEADANEVADEMRQKMARLDSTTVGQAIERYRQHLQDHGTGSISYTETTRRLLLFFSDKSLAIGRVTPARAAEYYETFRRRLRPDGEPISVSYHRATLINARSFLSWCLAQGWFTVNPLADVKGIGKRNAGKDQHTGNETRRLYVLCLARAEAGDKGALGVLMLLLMGLRSSDVTRRVVRDVDLDGTVLVVRKGKTKLSNRSRRIPLVLQPLLLRLVEGRGPLEPLFKTPYGKKENGGHHTRRWLEEAMQKLCPAAGLEYVCPHALKGTGGTLLVQTGELADKIADHLSHDDQATTKRHYIAPGAAEEAQAEQALKVIMGGR